MLLSVFRPEMFVILEEGRGSHLLNSGLFFCSQGVCSFFNVRLLGVCYA